jgi:hypothetical protein
MQKLNKTQTIVAVKSSNLIKATGIRGQTKGGPTTTMPDTCRVVVTTKTSGDVELRYVPLEPNRQSSSTR